MNKSFLKRGDSGPSIRFGHLETFPVANTQQQQQRRLVVRPRAAAAGQSPPAEDDGSI